jgi:inorganic triphosphatase YgiF
MERDTPRETELKLLVAPGELARLRRHPRLRELGRGRPRTFALESTYFDSADLDLLAAGAGLRLRRVGRSLIQTVKTRSEGQAGLFTRGEWEGPVSGDAPDLSAIPDPRLRAELLGAVGSKPLVPLLRTSVRRTRRVLVLGENEILCDLDVGEIHTPTRALPISELELELVRGEPTALFDLALELHESVPLRPALEGKAERGFAALLGSGPSARRGRKPTLAPDSTLDEALAEILGACAEQIAANEQAAHEGVDPEGVHQMRVGVRRLRSALALFKDWLPPTEAEPLRVELRWLGDALGGARDLDVFLTETLTPLLASLSDEPALKRLRDAADEMREEQYTALRAALDEPRFPRLLLSLGRLTAARAWRAHGPPPQTARLFGPARALADALLARRLRKARRLGTRIDTLTWPEKHRLRIELKKLRYAAEFFRGLHPGRRSDRMIRRLARLQDVLGHLNDRATADALLDRILARMGGEVGPEHRRAAGLVSGWTARGAEDALAQLERRWERFGRARPFWRV